MELEYLADMLEVCVPCPTEDDDFIYVDDHNVTQVIFEDIIDEPHECGWCICQDEGHDFPFIKAKFDFKSYFPHII